MRELTEMECGELAGVAAELGLGVLTGRERAEALAHLDRCQACRDSVRQLAMTGEDFLGLLPARQPRARIRDPGAGTDRPGCPGRTRPAWQETPFLPEAGPRGLRQVSRARQILAVTGAALAALRRPWAGWACAQPPDRQPGPAA